MSSTLSPTLGNVLLALVMLILASDGFFKIKTAWEFRKAGCPIGHLVHSLCNAAWDASNKK